jgi:hypothetical protein
VWRAAAPAAEADFILRTFMGAIPAKPCFRLLKERDGKFKTHNERIKTEVSSDTYPLRGKANRACGEAPRAPIPTGAAKGCPPPAGYSTVSASDARGAEGAICPGVVTMAEGPTPCASQRGHLLLGDRRIGLTPRSHNNCLGQGVKYPLGLPPLLGLGPWCPSPRH